MPETVTADKPTPSNYALKRLPTCATPPTWQYYVVDKAGIVRRLFNAQLSANRYVTETLEIVRQLTQDNGGKQDRP